MSPERSVTYGSSRTLDKGIELGLLLQEVGAGRPCCFFLQGQVHTLMSPVLLGMTGPNAFDADAQAQPPDGQLRQIEKSIRRSERNAIVGADRLRQATLLEQALKGCK